MVILKIKYYENLKIKVLNNNYWPISRFEYGEDNKGINQTN
jgi:hypothetical protein